MTLCTINVCRSTRLQVNHIPLRYRTGARFNPQVRQTFKCLEFNLAQGEAMRQTFKCLEFNLSLKEKPAEEREVEAEPDPDLIETAGVFSEESLVNVRKEVAP